MVFERDGFSNRIVTLPGFDKEISIGKLNYLRFDGLVEDIDEHTRKISREFRIPNNFGDGSELSGRTITLRYRDFVGSVIFYKDMGEAHNIFTLGHESVETLLDYGMGQTLVDFLRDAGFAVNDNIGGIPRELYGDIGGLLALHLRGKMDEFVEQYTARVHPGIIAMMYGSLRR